MENNLIIIRHGHPTSFDHCPKGTQCRVPWGDKFQLYVQMNTIENEPSWQYIGDFSQDIKENELIKEIKEILK